MQESVYDIMLMFWRVIINIFFREIRPRGAYNLPRQGALILVAAPHHNQFLDPLLLMSETFRETRRRVRCLVAAKSLKRKSVGTFISLMGSIPVARAADDAKPGKGVVWLADEDPCILRGSGTQFLSELAPKKQILLPKTVNSALAEVLEVISDTEVRVKKEFGGESGKGTSRIREKVAEIRQTGVEGLDYKILPYVDQREMYRHVYQCLTEGGCIGIFPEGGSHDRTDLLPLKAGVTIMALGAMANDPNLQVKILPVGLSYFHPHRFRSRAVVEFGHAMDIPPELVTMFASGGVKKREACGKLLDLIYDGLKTVTLRTPDYDTLMVIQAARRLYKTPGQHLTLGQVVELNKRFMEGYEHFKDEPRIKALRANVTKYNRMVRDLGLRDHQVPVASKATWKILGLLLYRVGLLLAWSILALPGVVLNGPIFLLASIISRQKAKGTSSPFHLEALAASTVKIAGRDVLATWKVLVSLGVTPILYGFYAFLATIVAVKANAPLFWLILTPVAVMIALPCIGFAALKFGEAGMDVLKSLRPLIVSVIPGQQKHLDRLKAMRKNLSNELAEVINEFGPQLYEDFDEWRIHTPSASVPPSGSSTGLWRRKTSTGAVDAQGNLLVHPMTWLDERLFGWSKSARRGTSVWADSKSEAASGQVSPDGSDDEDGGDYDNVLGYLGTYQGPSPATSKSKSARSSYADLQQLRMTTSSTSNTGHISYGDVGLEDHSPRLSPRQRKSSLSDGVPVERIKELDRAESFRDATEDINRENSLRRRETNLSPSENDS
ncbi:glycerol-3-phosphate O-acyltransferase [Sistotremastrum niveocremeum HHB9708]|uniref:Glycerol-3-phosphate O-acyltransferase n=1 Tax=Sistotremastrum niveocremeum HHB9708 TaxID=1314777 RepID=A0A164QR05_9AGAM|nr:glycerol-3-phosphate O-acyltransferase [Sistotremastrum niveocremeum HHB9708]